jgi:hypothetical protein
MSIEPPVGSFLFGDDKIIVSGKFYTIQDIFVSDGKLGSVFDGKSHPMRIQITLKVEGWRGPKYAILALALSPIHAKAVFDGIDRLIIASLNDSKDGKPE